MGLFFVFVFDLGVLFYFNFVQCLGLKAPACYKEDFAIKIGSMQKFNSVH